MSDNPESTVATEPEIELESPTASEAAPIEAPAAPQAEAPDAEAAEATEAMPSDEYTPRQITEDDLSGGFADAIDATMVQVEDGQLVQGKVVKIDKDEVLLDIGYKSEGVIPSRELSIRNDVDPNEIVSIG